MSKLGALLRQQSTHSTVLFAIIIALLAKIANIDLVEVTTNAGLLIGALVAVYSMASKIRLPDAPPPLSEAAEKGLEKFNEVIGDKP